jgi:hypothetical protein
MTVPRFVPRLALIALIAVTVTLGFAGCSRQSEGERCDQAAAGDTDCNSGLVCVLCVELAQGSVDRCCPADPNAASDPACARADPPRNASIECAPATGGTGGLGFGGFGGRAGAGSGGAGNGSGGTGGSGAQSGGEGGAPESGSGGA